METTRAIQFDEYGPPEVLGLAETETPDPGPGEIAIAVRAAGVQPFDCATRRGDFQRWHALTLPSGLGNEVAGVVTDAGPDADLGIGDEVIAFCDMTGYATRIVVPAGHAVRKPPAMGWAEAGALSVSGQTASTALDALGIDRGDRLLVHAGAGGVGSMAVQLAAAAGAQVVATASPANHAYLRDLGATPVAYGPGLADRVRELVPEGITAALDCVGGDALDVSLDLLGAPDRIVTVADFARHEGLGIRRVGTDRSRERLARLADHVRRGTLRVEVAAAYPLDQAAQAHHRVERGHGRGKVVLVTGGDR